MIEINIVRIPKIDLFKKSTVTRNSLNSGMTLVELLIAAALSVFVIAGGAFGVTTMMDRNAMLETRSQRRMELDRAISYIADEIKSANNVQIVQSGSTFPGNGTGVLLLTIPSTTEPNERVYFIRASGNPDTWIGPNTINRDPGDFDNPVAAGQVDGDVLVDGIIEPGYDELARIRRTCSTTDPNTQAVFEGAQGFYACVYTTNIAAETDPTQVSRQVYRVDLYLYGTLQYVAGHLKNDPTQENLLATTTVYPRVTVP